MSFAERRMTSATWPAVSSGRAVQTQAAAAATIGDEKLVPDDGCQSLPSALATMMSSPGAARSTKADLLENAATCARAVGRGDRRHVGNAAG